MLAVFAFILLVYVYSLFSWRLDGTILTMPLVFTLAGTVPALAAPRLVRRDVSSPLWLILAEITYTIVLFNGATRVSLRVLRGQIQLPGRLLAIGLPLTILLGMMAAVLVLPELSLWEAGVLACLLASTDTGLARRRGWASAPFQQIAMIALALLCLIVAKSIDTSPFIAAFAAGIALQIGFRDAAKGIVEFSENEGRLLHMFVFFLFGTVAGSALGQFHLAPVLYAVLSLTLVRMLPVAISMIGTRPSASSVLLSIFAHAISASPGIRLYARQIARLGADAPEYEAVSGMSAI